MTLGPVEPPVAVRLAGETYRIERLSTPLITVLDTGDWTRLVPYSLTEESQVRVAERLDDLWDSLDLRLLYRASAKVAEALLGGVPLYVAMRLVAVAREHWLIYDGWCLQHGFDPTSAPAHRVVSSVHAWLRSGCTERKEWLRIESALYRPPPGLDPDDEAVTAPGGWSATEAELFEKAFDAQ